MKKIILISAYLAMTLGLFGCQPNPNQPPLATRSGTKACRWNSPAPMTIPTCIAAQEGHNSFR